MFSMQFSEEQLKIQQNMKEFCEKEVAPGVAQRDKDGDDTATAALMKRLGELGFWGLPYPKEYGGSGADTLSYALASIELNKVDASLGCSYSIHTSVSAWIPFVYGTEEQKRRFATPMFNGEKIGAFGLTEPNAGSDAAMQITIAEKDGENYIINGTKCFITNSGHADTTLLFTMTDRSKGVKGITCFAIDKDTPGFNFTKKEDKMGIRGTVQRVIEIENMKVNADRRIGQEGEGFKIAMQALDGGRIGIGAQGVGIAEGAYEYALAYAKERVQFGKPIFAQQAVAFKFAEMATKIEYAKLLCLKAAWLKDTHQPYGMAAAMAKMVGTDVAMEVTTDAVQMMGGAGFLKDHPVERMMRDAKITQIYEGTNEIQKVVISGYIGR